MLLLRDLLEPIVEAFPLLGVLASPAPLTFLLVRPTIRVSLLIGLILLALLDPLVVLLEPLGAELGQRLRGLLHTVPLPALLIQLQPESHHAHVSLTEGLVVAGLLG